MLSDYCLRFSDCLRASRNAQLTIDQPENHFVSLRESKRAAEFHRYDHSPPLGNSGAHNAHMPPLDDYVINLAFYHESEKVAHPLGFA
jgi:hypothetical protein